MLKVHSENELIYYRNIAYYTNFTNLKEGTTPEMLFKTQSEYKEETERIKNFKIDYNQDKEFIKRVKQAKKNNKDNKLNI